MFKQFSIIVLLFCTTDLLFAQNSFGISIHEQESKKYSEYKFISEADYDRLNPHPNITRNSAYFLNKHIFGWNPYWVGTAYTSYNYNLLSTVAYFSYEVDTATGGYTTIHSWKTTNLVQLAHSNNVKVVLTVTNFGNANNISILGNAQKSQTLIDSIISLVEFRGADGVNIDFESVPASQSVNLVNFMSTLTNQIHTSIPGSKVSFDLPAVDWTNSFNVPLLNSICDQLIVMAYEYYWSGSSYAGPTAPLQSGGLWGNYNVTNSVNYFLSHGASSAKFLLGVPYYGIQWPTVSGTIHSQTTGTGISYQYTSMKINAMTYGRLWDPNSSTPWYTFQSSGWKQGWYDDSISLGFKYDFVNSDNLAGIGIWALGYDGSNNELWNEIAAKFGATGIISNGEISNSFDLFQNYPNPFNPRTKIKFSVPFSINSEAMNVILKVYDISGNEIVTLINDKLMPGIYEIGWDASHFSSGVYFYKLTYGDKETSKKMILIK